jgi:hypothetical protein
MGQFCKTHNDMIYAALDDCGLTPLCVPKGDVAAMNVRMCELAVHCGEWKREYFEPMLGAQLAITFNVSAAIEEPAATMVKVLPVCPLCTINKAEGAEEQNFDNWVKRAASDMLDEAKALGLVMMS